MNFKLLIQSILVFLATLIFAEESSILDGAIIANDISDFKVDWTPDPNSFIGAGFKTITITNI